jgi:ferric enterobactin receptor
MGLSYSDHLSAPFTLAKGEDKVLPLVNLSVLATVLEEIEVTARKPFLEQKAGRLVVNVDQMITGQGGSVTDMLKKVPGLVVVNDRVSMAGRSGVTILIDGRPTKYMDIQSLLNEMPADNIARIEVITQPGAAFDAEGTGGVINIILKKNTLFGTNGNITIGGGYGELAKYRAGINLNHRTGPWNLNFATGYNRRTWVERLDLDRTVGDIRFVQSSRDPGLPHSGYLRLGADYDINDQHRVGITANTYRSDNENVAENFTEIISAVKTPYWTVGRPAIMKIATGAPTPPMPSTAGKLTPWANSLASMPTIADYERGSVNDLLTTGGGDFVDRRNVMPANTQNLRCTGRLQASLGERWQFQTGAKISATRLENALQASILRNGAWTNDPELTNTFDYDEDIYAAYGNLVYSKGEYEANIGLRYESSQAVGYSATLDSTTTLDIAKFFPSISLATPFVGPLGTSVSYSYRIERPGYFDLNPFRYFLDPLTSPIAATPSCNPSSPIAGSFR